MKKPPGTAVLGGFEKRIVTACLPERAGFAPRTGLIMTEGEIFRANGSALARGPPHPTPFGAAFPSRGRLMAEECFFSALYTEPSLSTWPR